MNNLNTLFVACRSENNGVGTWGPVGRLEYVNDVYRFTYTKGARLLHGFRPFHGMEDLASIYESRELFPIFTNRLLSESRPEYKDFLRWSGFDPNNPPDPISLLGVTEGIRQTDSIEMFPCPIPDEDNCYLNRFFLHALRWMSSSAEERVNNLRENERLYLMLDICNPEDPHAVAIRTENDRAMIGYVPRYLAQELQKIAQNCTPDSITVSVRRVNLDAPLQQRLLCQMNACWPSDFQPCSDDSFLPIPASENSLNGKHLATMHG